MIVRDRNGTPMLVANDGPLVTGKSKSEAPSRVIPKPNHAACTTGEALAILQSVDPALTPDNVADLLTRNSLPRHACWDLQAVLALADSMAELRRSGKARRGLG
jgi:hypothetical protein